MRNWLKLLMAAAATSLFLSGLASGQKLESIGKHQVPQWYEDAKLGIFASVRSGFSATRMAQDRNWGHTREIRNTAYGIAECDWR